MGIPSGISEGARETAGGEKGGPLPPAIMHSAVATPEGQIPAAGKSRSRRGGTRIAPRTTPETAPSIIAARGPSIHEPEDARGKQDAVRPNVAPEIRVCARFCSARSRRRGASGILEMRDGGDDGDDGAIGRDAHAGQQLQADDGAENAEEDAEEEARRLENRRLSSPLFAGFSSGRHAA
jgi:hypothetical protein